MRSSWCRARSAFVPKSGTTGAACASSGRHYSTHDDLPMEFAADDSRKAHRGTQQSFDGHPSTSRHQNEATRPSRRYSDTASRKERALFQRDRSYSKRRPLLTAYPWHQLRSKSYFDDAERHYGRKETWAVTYQQDPERIADLTMLLADYLKDLHAQSNIELGRVKKMRKQCSRLQRQYQSYVIAGVSNPAILRSWAAEEISKAEAKRRSKEVDAAPSNSNVAAASTEEVDGTNDTAASPSLSTEDDERREVHRLQRRARGESAVLTNSAAFEELLPKEQRVAGYSAYPFLRQRAASKESHTLDPSLVDWSSKYFPDDDDQTFDAPKAMMREHGAAAGAADDAGRDGGPAAWEASLNDGGPTPGASETQQKAKRVRRYPTAARSKAALRTTLRGHLDTKRATFDAEGTFFRVRPLSALEDVGARRATPTKQIKPSEWRSHSQRGNSAEGVGDVVRVDWDTVVKSRATVKTPEVHRARERLVRLTRGEDPSSF
jgi:hypothetical protein